jgi:hypothetical protein
MEKIRIWDSGWKKVGSGIRDKHPGSATLLILPADCRLPPPPEEPAWWPAPLPGSSEHFFLCLEKYTVSFVTAPVPRIRTAGSF